MKDKVTMIGFIVILGTILTTVLVGVDTYTKPIIAKNEELKQKASIIQAFEIPYYRKETLEDVFVENVRGRGTGVQKYYLSKDGRIAFLFTGSGLWGPIRGVLAMDADMKRIKRVEIIYQEETPGLGGRIAERTFLSRFNDKTFAPRLTLVPEGKSSANNQIDGITGATLSSAAFVGILNEYYEQFSVIVSGE